MSSNLAGRKFFQNQNKHDVVLNWYIGGNFETIFLNSFNNSEQVDPYSKALFESWVLEGKERLVEK